MFYTGPIGVYDNLGSVILRAIQGIIFIYIFFVWLDKKIYKNTVKLVITKHVLFISNMHVYSIVGFEYMSLSPLVK